MAILNTALTEKVVNLLIPELGDQQRALTLVTLALGTGSPVLTGGQLDLSGRPLDRATTLCVVLDQPQLWAVLEKVCISIDGQDELKSIREQFFNPQDQVPGLAPGAWINSYQLIRPIGEGGNGEVWLARNRLTGLNRALKLLKLDVSQDRERVQRFQNEMRKATAIRHPHIIETYDAGTWFDGTNQRDYLIMQYVEGGSLREPLASGPLPFAQVQGWLAQLASALDHVHRQGIVHRDVKPENILLSADGSHIYLTDFGLAVNPTADPRITKGKTVVGTGRYMAPEQWTAATLDARTDGYALGIMTYELLTGVRPFARYESDSQDTELSHAHIYTPIDPHPHLAPKLWRIIRKMAAKQPDDRYPTAQAFVEDLSEWADRTLASAPQIMLSYLPADRTVAEAVAPVIARLGYQPRIDFGGIHASEIDVVARRQALEETAALLVIVTGAASDDPQHWIRREANIAREQEVPVIGLGLTRGLTVVEVAQQIGIAVSDVIDFTRNEDRAVDALRGRLAQLALPAGTPGTVGSAVTAAVTAAVDPEPEIDPDNLPTAYLRSWFEQKWATVPLTDYTGGEDSARLLDIYVPLRIDYELTYQVEGGQIIDWWQAEPETAKAVGDDSLPEREPAAERPRGRTWEALGVVEEDVQLIVDAFQRKLAQRGDLKDGTRTMYMEAHDAACVQPRFVLVGDPGSGKSSFVRHLTLCLAGELLHRSDADAVPDGASIDSLRDWFLGPFIPLYIELRSLVREAFPPLPTAADGAQPISQPTLDDFWHFVHYHVLGARLAGYLPRLREAVQTGSALIILDGLDEVERGGDPRRREQVKALLAALAGYEQCRIIVTSRPWAYKRGDWALDGFGRAELVGLEMGRLRELARALFAQIVGEQAETETQAFLAALEQDVPQDLRSNPLYFTMLAGLWLRTPADGERRLPQSRGALYRQSVDHLLERWYRRSGYSLSDADALGLPQPRQLRTMLEWLACDVHGLPTPLDALVTDTTEFTLRLLTGWIGAVRSDVPPQSTIAFLEQRSGILVSGRSGYLRFVHRSMQEHLAACTLTAAQPPLPPADLEAAFPTGLINRVQRDTDHWINVAQLGCDELLTAGRWDELLALLSHLIGLDGKPALLALQIADKNKLIERLAAGSDVALLRRICTRLMRSRRLTPIERAEVGRIAAVIGDRRHGVDLRPDGLPDIAWSRWIHPGTYPIGHADESDNPPRQHVLTYRYQIAKYPITYRQFQAFIDADDGWNNKDWWDGLAADDEHKAQPGDQEFKYGNHPRERVSWYDAMAFCRWLSYRLGGDYALDKIDQWAVRLPTEYEWEVAARGKDGRIYPYEGDFDAAKGNTDETGIGQTSAVGIFPDGASPFGALDMSGNVWEWCLTGYNSPQERAAAENLRSNTGRVLRGGGSLRLIGFFGLDIARAASRGSYDPGYRNVDSGFRLCRVRAPSH